MSATDDVARMLAMVPWLLAREGPTVDETMMAFDISEAQVHQDVERLNFCGLPGYRGGDLFECDLIGDRIVLSMADELRRPLRLGPAESVRMVLLLETAVRILDHDVPALLSGLAKVRRAAGVPDTVTVDVDTAATTWAAQLRHAVRAKKRVHFGYQGRADESPRRRSVDPWSVHVQAGQLYLQGHDIDAQDGRSFRLDRVTSLELSAEPVTTEAPASLPDPHYEPSPQDIRITLELAPRARWIAEVLEPESLVDRKNGGAKIVVRTDAPRWIEQLVLQGSGQARVIAPKSFRDGVAQRASAALARYDRVTARA
ncbi:MAG: putative DNA-binding transcriptional regulator YafY [Glaciecola sp.]|jgi:predicted DNA-binding transcriptional regulator YafY